MYYVYFLLNEVNETYIGSTNDLKRRMSEHSSGRCKSTKGHIWRLVYYEAYLSEKDARLREQKLKHFGQGVKHLKNRLQNSLGKN